jgi:hypothetical protein
MFPQSPYGVLRRPLVLILLLFLILFVALLPGFDTSRFLKNVPFVPPRHRRPRPPLHSSPFISPHPERPSRHRIKVQRPLTEPVHHGPWAQRADAVRGAFLHAYRGYLTHAAPHDELRPITNSSVDKCVCPLPRTVAAPVD